MRMTQLSLEARVAETTSPSADTALGYKLTVVVVGFF
jgi:hypothetical protein